MTILFIDDYDSGWNTGVYILDTYSGVSRPVEKPYKDEILNVFENCDINELVKLVQSKFFDGILVALDGVLKIFKIFDRMEE